MLCWQMNTIHLKYVKLYTHNAKIKWISFKFSDCHQWQSLMLVLNSATIALILCVLDLQNWTMSTGWQRFVLSFLSWIMMFHSFYTIPIFPFFLYQRFEEIIVMIYSPYRLFSEFFHFPMFLFEKLFFLKLVCYTSRKSSILFI